MKKNNWHNIDWKAVNYKLIKLQEELVVAHNNKAYVRVRELQDQIIRSYAARAMAVRRVTMNKGGITPGVDGYIWDTPKKRLDATQMLRAEVENLGKYRADPVLRVEIPKKDGSKRPLGIPTLRDRAMQAVFVAAIDPIIEATSDHGSYGFRKFRSTDLAIARVRSILDKRWSARWILEADIEKCFDKISHDYILENVPILHKGPIEEWVKAGVLDNGFLRESNETGTPQGGVISPMLCNMVLNGLDKVVHTSLKGKKTVENKITWAIRYADDFIVTSPSESQIHETIIPKVEAFLKQRGLNLSKAKTSITNIEEKEVLFLGWSIKRHPRRLNKNSPSEAKQVLIIKPTKDAEKRVRSDIKDKLKQLHGAPIEAVVGQLNPLIRGWCNYYSSSYHSQEVFQRLGHYLYQAMRDWCRKKHPTRGAKWIHRKYVFKTATRSWRWGSSKDILVLDPLETRNTLTRPLKHGYNPYTKDGLEYFENRSNVKEAEKFRFAVYKKHNFKCSVCKGLLSGDEPIELHHIKAKKDGGMYTLNNILPLHRTCHQKITYTKG